MTDCVIMTDPQQALTECYRRAAQLREMGASWREAVTKLPLVILVVVKPEELKDDAATCNLITKVARICRIHRVKVGLFSSYVTKEGALCPHLREVSFMAAGGDSPCGFHQVVPGDSWAAEDLVDAVDWSS